jgi:2-dehydro-3-deoxy-D-arabinonate dehydratase
MRLVAWNEDGGRSTWGVADDGGRVWDGGRHTGADLAAVQAEIAGAAGPGGFLRTLALPRGERGWDLAWHDLEAGGRALALPWRPPEVWAAGVTYEASEGARRRESRHGALYAAVYAARRPELFLKATAGRVRGPGEPVGLRPDSEWQVPEPEVALVLGAGGRIVGICAANDMSCRDIEGENPLYLPQAKVYDGACAIGPAVRLVLSPSEAARAREVAMRVERAGRQVFAGSTRTDRMVRAFSELVAWLGRAYTIAPGTILLTGTGIVPDDAFSLRPGDVVRVAVEGVGELVNRCEWAEGMRAGRGTAAGIAPPPDGAQGRRSQSGRRRGSTPGGA